MEYIVFSWYRWLKFKYHVKEKTKLNLEKRFGFCIKKRILIYVKGRDLTSITSKNGLDNWIKLYRNLKNPISYLKHERTIESLIRSKTLLRPGPNVPSCFSVTTVRHSWTFEPVCDFFKTKQAQKRTLNVQERSGMVDVQELSKWTVRFMVVQAHASNTKISL